MRSCGPPFRFDDCLLNPLAWNIVWNDEFDGTTINPAKWRFDTGNNSGWGNRELEYYTSRPQNAYASNGLLHIAARKEAYNGFNYTSARLKTQGRFAKQGGRFEFRAKLPAGVGFWPALWLLGDNFASVGWPASGEIDVMENKGSIPYQVQGTIHYSDAANNHLQKTLLYNLPNGGSVTNFHTYTLEWLTNRISWYVDGRLYETQTSWSSSTGAYPAPFNQPFFIVMNLAVGGTYLGSPSAATIDAGTVFPSEMQVDYLRVYDLTPPLEISVMRQNGAIVLSWPTNLVCHLQSQTQSDGIAGAWTDVPSAANPFIVPTQTNAFYRLTSP
jgi:beta-glucanase (GH16 family)